MTELAYSKVVSPRDHMWLTGAQWYFEVGLSALQCMERSLPISNARPTATLDMRCGHGRVCRMLRAAFPDAHYQPLLKVVGLQEAGWAGHQDVFSCMRLRAPYASDGER